MGQKLHPELYSTLQVLSSPSSLSEPLTLEGPDTVRCHPKSNLSPGLRAAMVIIPDLGGLDLTRHCYV